MAKHSTAVSATPFPARFAHGRTLAHTRPHKDELLPFEHPKGKAAMTLGDYFPKQAVKDFVHHGSISFHAFGDSGVGSQEQHDVADAMSRDIDEAHHERSPAFLLHLGDVIYGPGKRAGYANRFYRPNENYHNLVFAIPGNHDGEVRSAEDGPSLSAFLDSFCQPTGKQPAMGMSFGRAMPNQPGAYWRLTCPFVDIVGLYSGTGENYGAIAHPEIGDDQKVWLAQTLRDIAAERGGGASRALILAVHHPPYASGLTTGGFGHPGNPDLLKDMDACCRQAGVWPDAVLAAHAHSYQRYMRSLSVGSAKRTIPYLVAGGGGIAPQKAPAPIGTVSDGVRNANGISGNCYQTVSVSAKKLTQVYTQTEGSHRQVFETASIDLHTGEEV